MEAELVTLQILSVYLHRDANYCNAHLLFCDALQTHMKHFQHLRDLKYKSHTTYIVTDSNSCNNCDSAVILLYTLPALAALLPCSSAKCSG